MRKLLIANRGEIACRIMATARRLGLATVAVYSDADRDALHVASADEAVRLGPAEPTASYLDQAAVLDAARRTGADALHPGYGFLSENAVFARACAEAGICFVGPPPAAIESMGSKSAAKAIMANAGVPLLPGYHGDDQSPARLAQAAEDIGFPVLLKATAGGGGKGMRIVESAGDFNDALAAAQREAANAFGDDRMLVEKFLAAPRHVEVQVFADRHGNGIHLHDRDCSVQRRYQKIIEEAPAPGLSDALRARMGAAAVAAAAAIGYEGAGTVEFLVDGDAFFFMEMNTRLQVEHPVTEAITGIDLVAWQLAIAQGEPLPLDQDSVPRIGHAIEARLYAEDADNEFLPTPGPVHALRWPTGPDAPRIDTGVRAGDAVSIHYDPMIAKLIVHADDRDSALSQLRAALSQTLIVGLTTNVDYLLRILATPSFANAELSTGLLASEGAALAPGAPDDSTHVAAALAAWHVQQQRQPASPWHGGNGSWPNLGGEVCLRLALGDVMTDYRLAFAPRSATPHTVSWASTDAAVDAFSAEADCLHLTLDGHRITVPFLFHDDTGLISIGTRQWPVALLGPDTGDEAAALSDGTLRAPMTGRIVAVHASVGERVARGAPVLVLEAMKMAHTLTAPADGTLESCSVAAGDLVEGGSVLATLTLDPTH